MYTPKSYREERLEVLHALMAAHPLGALVRMSEDGLCADHLPFEIAPPTPDAPFGTLRAHVARANPLWRGDGVEDHGDLPGAARLHHAGLVCGKRTEAAKKCRPLTTPWCMRTASCKGDRGTGLAARFFDTSPTAMKRINRSRGRSATRRPRISTSC